MKYKLLDLFSGIGGFSLGLERSGGFKTVAFCEIDPFCRKVLRKHWPDVRQYEDVTKLTAEQLRADGIGVAAICGGFPCQDISVAGKGAGIAEGTRSGLWSEFARLIGELRPKYVIVENVAALLSRGLGRVLGDLAALGYDAEWHCIPASSVGAPHRRDRVWIIANASGFGCDWGGHVKSSPFQEPERPRERGRGAWNSPQPRMLGVAHGVPYRVDRIRSLGNAVVPQIPELIGKAIMEAENARL
jgi:DNA (cytosine-5)-methyltransferase 1